MRRPVVILALVLIAMLAALAGKGLLVQPPPLRTQAAADRFDAAAAKARLGFVLGDQRPHPTDSATSDLVRARIVASLQDMGLTPIVRDQVACNELYKARGVSCARVRNVIAVLGPASGKAVLLNAHYDSTPVGPAAGDDGIGVATLLETAARLKTARLDRPVILLFNEGEELGLVGARAFLSDPLARNVDSLVNLEARGVRGPVNMFETSRPNAGPIRTFAAAVERPVANSLSTDVYRLMPNYTDVNSFSERGWFTLNLAPIGNETRYHSPGDNLAALDPATLQHMGDQTLALARVLSAAAQAAGAGDRIFMDVAGRLLVSLPLMLGVVLLAIALLGTAGFALRRKALGRGMAMVAGTFVASGALAFVALELVGLVRPGMFWRANPMWSHLAIYATAGAVAVLFLSLLRKTCAAQLRPVFWLFFALVGAGIGIAAPGGIVFFIFPPLVALAGMIAARWWEPAERLASAAAILLLFLTWGAMLGLLEELLNAGPLWLFAPLGSLLVLPVVIEAKALIESARVRAAAILAGAVALLLWGTVLAVPAYSADRQQRFVIQHISDAASGKSYWSVMNDGAPLPAAMRNGRDWTRGKLPIGESLRWLTAAPEGPAARPPQVTKVAEIRSGTERTMTLRLAANGNERVALIGPEDAHIRSAGVAGFVRRIDQNADGKYLIDCFGRSCDGLQLQLVTGQAKPINFLVVGSRGGVPALAQPLLAARPGLARPQYARDETIAFDRVRM